MSSKESDRLRQTLSFEGREIELRVDPDGEDLEVCLGLARDVTLSLEDLVAKAKSAAAVQLLAEYNESWREYRKHKAEGSMEDVVDPVLTEAAFSGRLSLVGLAVEGDTLEFCFNDGGLFAGHSIFVTAFDGMTFNDVSVMLYG